MKSLIKITVLLSMMMALHQNRAPAAEGDTGAGALTQLPVLVGPADLHLRYIGRFTREEAGPRCAWSACTVKFKFEGTAVQAELEESKDGKDFWQVIVDGTPTISLELRAEQTLYPVVSGLLKREHTVELVKRTEAGVGTTRFKGLHLDAGARLLPAVAPAHRIEVIGDSISCGYGNEAAGKEEHFSPATENGTLAYGAVAARLLGADYLCVAWSGKKLWPDNSIVPLYDFTLPRETASGPWDFSTEVPDAVVINLGTNDFGRENPEEAGWIKAYIAFIRKIRANYPRAHLYCMVGPMMNDQWPPGHKTLSTVRGYLAKVLEAFPADPQMHLFDSGPQDAKANGLGADLHPSLKTDRVIGENLAEVIRKDLAW